MKIGVYGGTFDPPHLGHMQAARAAAERLGLDKILFVPAALPPHKALPPESVPAEERLAMTALMADGLCLEAGRPGLAGADGLELSRQGKSYTVDTLEELRRRYPDDELWLLMGTDMFLTLQDWRDPERITVLAGIAAFARSEADRRSALEAQGRALRERYGAQVAVVELPQIIDLSSTQVRALLETDRAQVRDALWCQVYGYILLHSLYGVRADLRHLDDDDLRCASLSMVKAKRVPHIRGCEAEAVRLAEYWGADPHLARRAGILHDCTKYLELDEQLALCEKYAVPLDDLERVAVKLLHSKTGAAIARHVFGEPDEVCNAIYWHTTGKADMDLLSKILYLADYIEPSRADFEGLEELRRLAYTDLDAALLLGCELTIQDMEERGVPVHTNTLQARDFLKGRT
ncbi:bis(5'-nucleosyl)-tetraphosphatase (symmetrical) YqeK [Intestinimonas sp.]|uniref:bis(5'-nucleosyl)-tetraphosphatase (symmetrical) YqeK n=1 Tax=Intestinimonas sp. TaxID=1965293 RepID=UPI0026154F1D|nr:bis(5'-nucleosyl)-tetraphosphatase (symmetrical) YqeK [Intestinimonas sp.]